MTKDDVKKWSLQLQKRDRRPVVYIRHMYFENYMPFIIRI